MSKFTITVKRAEKIYPDDDIPEITLKTEDMPRPKNDPETFYMQEADRIMQFLMTLPQATLEPLMAKLLIKRGCLYVGKMENKGE